MPKRKRTREVTVKDVRTILRLSCSEGLSVREIADRLRIGKSSVSTYLYRGRQEMPARSEITAAQTGAESSTLYVAIEISEPPEGDEQLAGERHDHHPTDPCPETHSRLMAWISRGRRASRPDGGRLTHQATGRSICRRASRGKRSATRERFPSNQTVGRGTGTSAETHCIGSEVWRSEKMSSVFDQEMNVAQTTWRARHVRTKEYGFQNERRREWILPKDH